jgi:plastocyanin
MTFEKRKLLLLLLTALASVTVAFAAVACGGGDDDDDDNGGDETPSGNGGGQTAFDLLMNESDGNVFLLDSQKNPTLTVPAGKEVTINLENDGSAIHNMRFAGEDKKYNTSDDAVSKPDIVAAGQKAVLVFTAPGAGTYAYQCDFHPTDMLGEIKVEK